MNSTNRITLYNDSDTIDFAEKLNKILEKYNLAIVDVTDEDDMERDTITFEVQQIS